MLAFSLACFTLCKMIPEWSLNVASFQTYDTLPNAAYAELLCTWFILPFGPAIYHNLVLFSDPQAENTRYRRADICLIYWNPIPAEVPSPSPYIGLRARISFENISLETRSRLQCDSCFQTSLFSFCLNIFPKRRLKHGNKAASGSSRITAWGISWVRITRIVDGRIRTRRTRGFVARYRTGRCGTCTYR